MRNLKPSRKKIFIPKKILLFWDALGIFFLLLVDQLLKDYVTQILENGGSIVVIDGVLQLTLLKNTGGIFGFLQNQTPFILFTAGIFILVILYLLVRLPDMPRFQILHPVFACMLAGALGNVTDRLRFGYVIDFIYFVGIDFPVFNPDDILISVSVVILICLLLFYYKEKDFKFLTFKQERYRELK